MRRLGARQRMLLSALSEAGNFSPLVVSEIGTDAVDRPMSEAEYRALNRAAHSLANRSLHLTRLDGSDYRGRAATRLAAWTCPNCSLAATGEHEPLLPCLVCGEPTARRDYRGRGDCGAHRASPPASAYPIEHAGGITYYPIEPVLLISEGGVELREVTLR